MTFVTGLSVVANTFVSGYEPLFKSAITVYTVDRGKAAVVDSAFPKPQFVGGWVSVVLDSGWVNMLDAVLETGERLDELTGVMGAQYPARVLPAVVLTLDGASTSEYGHISPNEE